MKNAFIGSAVERREDLRFLRGRGEYLDDLHPEGLLHAVILRSSVAHGQIVSIDASAALKIPGVHAVITNDPRLFGFPRFYWLQLAFILLGVGTTTLVYQMTKRRR